MANGKRRINDNVGIATTTVDALAAKDPIFFGGTAKDPVFFGDRKGIAELAEPAEDERPPIELNLQIYIGNDPVNYIDPRGLFGEYCDIGRGGMLSKCLDACEQGGRSWGNFCRSLKDKKAKAACWALQFAGVNACRGWCFWRYAK